MKNEEWKCSLQMKLYLLESSFLFLLLEPIYATVLVYLEEIDEMIFQNLL